MRAPKGSILFSALLLILLFIACVSGRGLESSSDNNTSNNRSAYGSSYGIKSTKEEDLVVGLPGQPNVSFAQYAGYVTVNESHGRALFYWFFEAASDRASKPLVLWLNGGPGCSSVGYGEAEELGPFIVNKDSASVSYNSYAWNNEVNLIFLESPAGVGFSYSNTTSDYDHFGDSQTALDAYAFLVGWLEKFPEYKGRDFFIAGESYAGHYVPQLAKVIHEENKSNNSTINLKGIMMGNALVDYALDGKGIVDYAWSHGVISDAFYQNITSACGDYGQNRSDDCQRQLYSMYQIYSLINIYSIDSDICLNGTSNQNLLMFEALGNGKRYSSNTRIPSGGTGGANQDPCLDTYVNIYLNRKDVQQALHVAPTTWLSCNQRLSQSWTDAPFSMLPTLQELINDGLRIWMYSGDLDGRIPLISTRYSIGSMKLPVKIDWYPWYYQGQVAGWSEVYDGLTFATVRGAGHMVPSLQASRALALFSQFLLGSPLPNSRSA